MTDALQVGSSNTPQCYTCEWSFRVQPTFREIKLGVALLTYYCAHKAAIREMGGDKIPMRCDDTRASGEMCGKQARWWKEYKETPLFSFEMRGTRTGRESTTVGLLQSNTPKSGTQGPIIREPGVTKKIEIPGRMTKSPRKPYEV